MDMFDTLLHKWLNLPYVLHERFFRRNKTSRATVLFLHGIGNNGSAWRDIADKLPNDINSSAIDLLGFGKSPKPDWATYDAKRQAKSVMATYGRRRNSGKLIVVGHSLGSLVAIEIAKRYPLLVDNLILCSPPLYRADDSTARLPRHPDALLRRIYAQAERYPDSFFLLAEFATRYRLVNESFSVTKESLKFYIGNLRAMILNQTALSDIEHIKTSTHIIYGSLDPLVVGKNIRRLEKTSPSITTQNVLAGHEVKGAFAKAVIRAIDRV